MLLRERSTTGLVTGGYWFRTSEPPGTQHPRADVTEQYKYILDFHGKEVRKDPDPLAGFLPASDLELKDIWRVPSRMTRTGTGLNLIYAAADYGGDVDVRSALYKTRGSLDRQVENNSYAIDLMSKANPFRTDYSIPVAIKELTDISSMFRFAGGALLNFLGGSYLNYKFGWEQFLKDLGDIQRAVDLISSRVREFESLNKHGGLRRKIWLDQRSLTEVTPNKPIQSSLIGAVQRAECRVTATMKVYGTLRWVPKTSFRAALDRLDKTKLALSVVFDIGEIQAESLWNMIPFSWVVDYFLAVGDFLSLLRGQDYIEPRDLCIMREYSHREDVYPGALVTSVAFSKGFSTLKIKARDVWVPANVPPFQVRFLSGTQLTNLGALIATVISRFK